MRSLRGVVLLSGLGAVLGAAPALAWNLPTPVTDRAVSSQNPLVAMDAQGRSVGIWTTTGTPAVSSSWRVAGATRVLGGAWTPLPAPISGTGVDSGADVNTRSLALDVAGDGAAIAAWIAGANRELQSATSTAFGSPFGGVTTMTVPAGPGSTCTNNTALADDQVVGPTAELGPSVRGYLAWTAPCGGTSNGNFQLVKETDANGNFIGGVTKAGKGQFGIGPELAYDPATGRTLVMFNESGLTVKELENGIVQPNPSNYGTGRQDPQIRVQPDGTRIIAWREPAVPALKVQIGAGTPQQVNPMGESAGFYRMDAGADGTVAIAWRRSDFSIAAAVRSPVTGTWGPAHTISDPGTKQFDVAVSDTGVGYVVWNRDAGSFVQLEAAILDPQDPGRAPGTPFQFQPVPEILVSPGDTQIAGSVGDVGWPRVAVTAAGTAQVLFPFVAGSNPQVTFAIGSIVSPIDRSTPPPQEPPTGGPPPGPAPAAPSAAPAADTRAPRISGFVASRREFGTGERLDRVLVRERRRSVVYLKRRSALRVGTVLRWSQDEPGTARITISHEGCFTFRYNGKPSQSLNRCAKGLIRDGVVYSRTLKSKTGANRLTYLGLRQGKRPKLRVGGLYRAELTVTDAAGNRSAPKRLPLEVDGSLADD
jgi:hypothetical protein